MPKVPDGYQPKGERVRIREKEAEYIRQVAEKYQESFLDALYRIVNYHRDNNLIKSTNPTPSPATQAPSVVKESNNDSDIDLDMFA